MALLGSTIIDKKNSPLSNRQQAAKGAKKRAVLGCDSVTLIPDTYFVLSRVSEDGMIAGQLGPEATEFDNDKKESKR
jgi:hypothetical protein